MRQSYSPQILAEHGIPYSSDISPLGRSLALPKSRIVLGNRLTVHPMEGFDSDTEGAPGPLTTRRYLRFARSGAALCWSEAIAVTREGRSSPHQLMLDRHTSDGFKRLVDEFKSKTDMPIIAQITHSGRFSKPDGVPAPIIAYHNPRLNERLMLPSDYPVAEDAYFDALTEKFVTAAELAADAGFDGVDIKCCHRYLFSELLSAYDRPGRYGGSYENRTRLFRQTVEAVSQVCGGRVALMSRFGFSDMIEYPYGFGMKTDGSYEYDLTEADRLCSELYALGVGTVNLTCGTPYYNPQVNRPFISGAVINTEDPLDGVARLLNGAAALQRSHPEIAFIGTGYSLLADSAAGVAAAEIDSGGASAVGFGRLAFAYEGFAADMLEGRFNRSRSCVTCGKCTEIMRAGGTTGCPIRDSEIYVPIYGRYCRSK